MPTEYSTNSISPAKKSLGQHWLNDEASLTAIGDAAEINAGDTVLEIGPGLGSLTKVLIKRAKKVVAVEKDEALAENLSHQLSLYEDGPRTDERNVNLQELSVIRGDILRFDFASLPTGYKIAANIPYYLTSNLIRVISESSHPPKIAVLLVQKEVAERAAASPGQMSLLAVLAQFYWEVSLGRVVGASLFEPPPKVDSQIIKLVRRQQPLFPGVDPKIFFRLVKAGFSQRRKTLTNNLAASYQLEKSEAASILENASINPTARAQTLSLADWKDLLDQLPEN